MQTFAILILLYPTHCSAHTDSIITEDQEVAEVFLRQVDRYIYRITLSYHSCVFQLHPLPQLMNSFFSLTYELPVWIGFSISSYKPKAIKLEILTL